MLARENRARINLIISGELVLRVKIRLCGERGLKIICLMRECNKYAPNIRANVFCSEKHRARVPCCICRSCCLCKMIGNYYRYKFSAEFPPLSTTFGTSLRYTLNEWWIPLAYSTLAHCLLTYQYTVEHIYTNTRPQQQLWTSHSHTHTHTQILRQRRMVPKAITQCQPPA